MSGTPSLAPFGVLAVCCGLLLAGCVRHPVVVAQPRQDPEVARAVELAADQVKRCYRAPRAQRDGRGIVTSLRVAYAPDGTLAELPSLVSQRGVSDDNARIAADLADAAASAVVRCTPLKLPPERYRNGWDSFVLTFSQKAAA
jgi:hypothetical protein